jgi:acyl-CoA thioesterase
MSTSTFAQQLDTVRATGSPGAYRAELSDIWNCPVVPHGGLVTATVLRAVELELGRPEQKLRSVTNMFASQVHPGPVDIDVTILRHGRSMSQVSARVRNPDGDAGHALVALYGAERVGFEFTDVALPEVPPPEECPSFRDPLPEGVEERMHLSFWDYVEGRPALGTAPWEDVVRTASDRAAWYRFDEPPMLDDGRLDPLALVTLCDTMPGAVSERLGRSDQPWVPPSGDLTVHVLGDARSEWVLAHNRARHCGEGYGSVEILLWDPAGTLVAYGTQVMFFVFPDGPPPPEARRPRD